MAALKGKGVDRFLERRDPAFAALLVYGPDAGLVRERALRLARSVVADLKDPFNAIELSDADLKAEPARLVDEAAALSFAGGERVVRLRTVGDAAAPAAKLLIDALDSGALKPNALTVIEAGDLSKGAKLRKMFEAAKRAATIPCYEDAPQDLRAMAEAAAAAEGLRFDPEAMERLTGLLGEDRALSRSEVDKLILYVGPKGLRQEPGRIRLEDVEASLVDTISDASDDAAAAAADGDAAALALALHRMAGAGGSPIALLRALQRQFSRLLEAQAQVARGATPADAMKRLRPPVFFKEQRAFQARLRRWPLARIEAALDALLAAEIAAKRTGAPQAAIAERAAFALAAAAR